MGDDIGLGSVTDCCLKSFSDHRQHPQHHSKNQIHPQKSLEYIKTVSKKLGVWFNVKVKSGI